VLAFRSSGTGQRGVFCLPLAELNVSRLAELFCRLNSQFRRKEWLEELGAFQAFYDRGIGYLKSPDFLGFSIQYGYKEYLEHVFNDPSRYTSEYKSHLLIYASSIMLKRMTLLRLKGKGSGSYTEHGNTQELARWLGIINFLLSQGCKSELASLEWPVTEGPYMVTGLEEFLWSLLALCRRVSWDKDSVPWGLIIETLRHFSESGADFMQPVYGYYGRDGLFNTSHSTRDIKTVLGSSDGGEQSRLGSIRQVVVESSTLEALTRVFDLHHRDNCFCGKLQEFLATIRKDANSLKPRIIAVRHPYNLDEDPYSRAENRKLPGSWIEKAKRVSDKHGERLMNNISQWISQNDDDATTKMEKLDEELDQIVNSILDDGDVPEGVFEYFRELGFVESWPRFLAYELREMGFTRRIYKGYSLVLPEGVIYPPVKFIDQLKSDGKVTK
jgi:hypothetical protein